VRAAGQPPLELPDGTTPLLCRLLVLPNASAAEPAPALSNGFYLEPVLVVVRAARAMGSVWRVALTLSVAGAGTISVQPTVCAGVRVFSRRGGGKCRPARDRFV
jgi:hypothetical protein